MKRLSLTYRYSAIYLNIQIIIQEILLIIMKITTAEVYTIKENEKLEVQP